MSISVRRERKKNVAGARCDKQSITNLYSNGNQQKYRERVKKINTRKTCLIEANRKH